MIVDCFTFFNEFDVLDIRFRTLENVVDRFVLCEAPFTFRGEPKPLYYHEQAERFERWRDRITVLTFAGPASPNAWENEWGQRDFLMTALADCAPDDLILLGDCDEIPDPRYAARYPQTPAPLAHKMVLAMGYINRFCTPGEPIWYGTRAVPYERLAAFGTLSALRKYPDAQCEAVNSGWHLTSLGGAAVMARKMRSYSHAENDIPYQRDLRRLETFYGENAIAAWVPFDDRFPAAMHDERFAKFVLAEPAEPLDATTASALEHAHGCFAYVPDDAAGVAVMTTVPGAWERAGRERFGDAFAGVVTDATAIGAGQWVVVDGLERLPDCLERLRARGAAVVAFASNARSYHAFRQALSENGTFAPGRAHGRAEYLAAIGTAGFRADVSDRIATSNIAWPALPPQTETLFGVNVDTFGFPSITTADLADFLSDAFVFVLSAQS